MLLIYQEAQFSDERLSDGIGHYRDCEEKKEKYLKSKFFRKSTPLELVKIPVLVTLMYMLKVSTSPFYLHSAGLNKLVTFNHHHQDRWFFGLILVWNSFLLSLNVKNCIAILQVLFHQHLVQAFQLLSSVSWKSCSMSFTSSSFSFVTEVLCDRLSAILCSMKIPKFWLFLLQLFQLNC